MTLLLWLLALAQAGTLYVDAANPVLVKLDGRLVRPDPSLRVIAPELDPGTYHVEITNLLGKTIAFADVDIAWDEDTYLEFDGEYLDEIKPPEEVVVTDTGVPIIPDVQFIKMNRKLVKGSAKKKLGVLDKMTRGWMMTMAQTDQVLSAFHTREDRLSALVMILDRMAEPDKYNLLDHHFAVTSDRERMHQLFEALLAVTEK